MKRTLTALALLPVLAACSGAPGPAETPSKETATPSPTTSPTPSPSPTMAAPSFTTDELALLQATGWSPEESGAPGFIDSAHDLCDTFDQVSDEDAFTALREGDSSKRQTAGQILLLLCGDPDRYAPLLVAVTMPEARASGTYYVGDGENELQPGEYKTVGGVQDCYWVRKDSGGDIIDNDLVSNAPGGVRLTVKASDYEVTMERCGIWIPAG